MQDRDVAHRGRIFENVIPFMQERAHFFRDVDIVGMQIIIPVERGPQVGAASPMRCRNRIALAVIIDGFRRREIFWILGLPYPRAEQGIPGDWFRIQMVGIE